MSPRTEEQFEEIRESRKMEIMNTALELFANHGYHTTSISNISEKAGISKGLLYNYFSSKEQLLKSIIDEGIKQISSPIDPNKDGILTEEKFVYYIDEVFELMAKDTVFYKLYFSLLLQPGIFEKFFEKLKRMLSDFSRLLVPFFKMKGIPNPEEEVYFFGAILDGLGLYYINEPGQFPLEKMKRRILKMYQINPEDHYGSGK